ncbi:PREDICTED: U3 small nucleolar RNA-associated protein 18 homolog [Amphimedon queenslandica]|uniref:U3 small nucleolar RNA-associated protein 18 homolog n=1 Tax=Amphimedon queenslandica TaxID=400682 RepID=A0A1X7UMC0_AMPQE|nr:PREDICTED: U3 small nucleolar RNA-associated protein 18 homolog [Amphimedon queenslandica]|eukprot:XP_019853534.1 PREDICTED: U3 small nucleolar RNA-associated protein 18 homolog [Amphimedon queenslandica]
MLLLRRKTHSSEASKALSSSDTFTIDKERRDGEPGEEERLEKLVFGRQPFISQEKSERRGESPESNDKEESENKRPRKAAPVWFDEDDDVIKIDLKKSDLTQLRKTADEDVVSGREFSSRLRDRFQKITKEPEWSISIPQKKRSKDTSVDSDSEGEEEEEDNLLAGTGRLLAGRVSRLPGETIDIKPMGQANKEKPAQAVLQSLEFHPSAHVILTAGRHKTLSLFQVDGDSNPLLQSVHLQRFPILTSHFSSDGTEVIMAGERHWFYVFDMMSGKIIMINEIKGHSKTVFSSFRVSPDNQLLAFISKDGFIPLVSNKTKQWIADLKMNGQVTDVAFSPDSNYLLSTGTDGHVYVWDLHSRDCVHRFTDDGCIKGTSLRVSPSGSYVACGSDSGVVNLYEWSSCFVNVKPKPLKSIMNLTTSISSVEFNHSNEILAMSSNTKASAFKLLHIPSLSVFSNWPSQKTPLKNVYCHSFSSDSHYMALGNDQGKALLYRLNHYHKGFTAT